MAGFFRKRGINKTHIGLVKRENDLQKHQEPDDDGLYFVRLRTRSDAPVGSCLSGGLNSSITMGILFSHNNLKKTLLLLANHYNKLCHLI